jgi:predicted RNase H-like HicB family nuclease
MLYVGILCPHPNGWRVRIPDIEGCWQDGPTPAEAIGAVTADLRDHVESAASIGHRLPAPTPAKMVVLVKEPGPDEIVVLIPITLPAPDLGYPALTAEQWEEWDQTT